VEYRKPESMDECVYYTLRDVGKGSAVVWVFKNKCPECGNAIMGKPKDPKTGRPKIRAKEYVCPECGHIMEKKEYEESLIAYCEYICPECGAEGITEAPFIRKSIGGVQTLRFNCKDCGANIEVTKKMKEKKKKK